jgi:ABC-2 type transport system permease protein
MIGTIKSEWIKIRTVRMNYVLLFLAVGFPLVVTSLTTALTAINDLGSRELVDVVLGTTLLTALLLGVMGAASITSEFGFGTIRPTFTSTPQRVSVLISKALVTIVAAAFAQAVVALLCTSVGAAITNARGGDVSISDLTSWRSAYIGSVFFAMIAVLFGLGLGMIIRSSAGTISTFLLWPVLGEGIIAGLLFAAKVDEPGKWLPFSSGINLASPEITGGFDRLPSGLYFFAVAALLCGLGVSLVLRRDA